MELVRFFANDGVELVGALYVGNKETAIIHLHGYCGNFYENPFVDVLGRELSKSGITFLAINTRAHDYRSDLKIKTEEGFKSATGGGAVDNFYDSEIDISSAVSYLKNQGYQRIIVQGHSTSAQKALNYALKFKHNDIILLSAGDIYSEITVSNKNSEAAFKEARKMISDGKGKEYMSEALWGVNHTAEALINGYGNNTDSDLFPIRTGKVNPKTLEFTGNVLNVLGTNDSYLQIYTTHQVAEPYFKEALKNANHKFILLDDTHAFTENPTKLASEIVDWCKTLK